jgi:hypothetical protein
MSNILRLQTKTAGENSRGFLSCWWPSNSFCSLRSGSIVQFNHRCRILAAVLLSVDYLFIVLARFRALARLALVRNSVRMHFVSRASAFVRTLQGLCGHCKGCADTARVCCPRGARPTATQMRHVFGASVATHACMNINRAKYLNF